jgi:hypothetical protein
MTTLFYNRIQFLALYPNNEVRFGSRAVPQSKSKAGEVRPVIVLPEIEPASLSLLPGDARAVTGGGASAALDRNIEFQEHQNQQIDKYLARTAGHGLLPQKWPNFTNRAIRSMSLRSSAIGNVFPLSQQVFLTGTLPGSTPEALRAFAEYSSYIMGRVTNWLSDNYSVDDDFQHYPKADRFRKKNPRPHHLYHCAVWEFQTRGALHYHGLVATPRPAELIASFKTFWIGLLEQVSLESEVDLFEKRYGGTWRVLATDTEKQKQKKIDSIQVNAQVVKKSISAYLSKYLTKNQGSFDSGHFPPARWWSSTRALARLAESQTVYLRLPAGSIEQSEELLELTAETFHDLAPFACEITNPYSKQQVGSLGIFDSLPEAAGVFNTILTHCTNFLADNIGDIEVIHALRFAGDYAYHRLRDQIERDLSAQDIAEYCTGTFIGRQISKYKQQKKLQQQFIETYELLPCP